MNRLRKYYCAIGKAGRYDVPSLRYTRKECIYGFVQDCDPQLKTHSEIMKMWDNHRRNGWRVEKVFVTIEPRQK